LFLRFEGPTTMLLQSRGSRISDVLTLRDVNEIAESPPGAVQDVVDRKIKEELKEIAAGETVQQPPSSTGAVKYATVRGGKTEFEKPSA
jgi:tripartite-type tricarboxylate transporter receptor subunit TctC